MAGPPLQQCEQSSALCHALGRPPRQHCKQSSAPVARPDNTYLPFCGTCRELAWYLPRTCMSFCGNLWVLVHRYKDSGKVLLFITRTHELPQKDTQVPYKYPTSSTKSQVSATWACHGGATLLTMLAGRSAQAVPEGATTLLTMPPRGSSAYTGAAGAGLGRAKGTCSAYPAAAGVAPGRAKSAPSATNPSHLGGAGVGPSRPRCGYSPYIAGAGLGPRCVKSG